MAENEISDYFEIDNDNIDIAGISVQENVMRPPAVNNAFRALQGALKRWFRADRFRLRDSTDQTKLAAFSLAGIPPATTNTYTLPSITSTLVGVGTGGDATIAYSDNGATAGPVFQLDRFSASPATSDLLGLFTFRGYDSGAAVQTYAAIATQIGSPTAGAEEGTLLLQTVSAGAVATRLSLTGVGASVTGAVSASGSVNTATNFNAATHSGTGASAGVLIVGNSGGAASVRTSTTSTAAQLHSYFVNPNGQVGSITTSGTTTAYNTTSDQNLKANFRDFDSGKIIDAVKVYLYDWKAGGTGYGMKAQEAWKVFPDAVTPGNDMKPGDEGFIPWSMDLSKFVPVLLREVQDLRKRLDAAGL